MKWFPTAEWLTALERETAAEVERLDRTVRMRLGSAILDFFRRPWRVVALTRRLLELLRDGPAGLGANTLVPPYPEADWAEPDDRREALRQALRDHRQRILEIQSSPAYRLGTELLERRSAALLDLARTWAGRQETRPTPAQLPTRHRPVEGSMRLPNLRDLRCLGPDWWIEMLRFEGLREAPAGWTGDLLVGLADGADTSALEAVSPARRAIAWVLGDEVPEEWLTPLGRCHHVAVGNPDLAPRLQALLDVPVSHLPPAVQPKLDNPIGWWAGRPDLACAPRSAVARPAAWRWLSETARGLALETARRAALDARLGEALPDPSPPSWADACLAPDWARLARYRAVLEHHDLRARLRRIAPLLDLPLSAIPGPERVTATFTSNRPQLQGRLLETIARQTHPNLLVLGVLHGGNAATQRRLEARAEALGLEARFLRVSADRSLGEAQQVGFDGSEGQYIVRFDDDDHYGPRYAADMSLALRFSEAGIVFKHTCLVENEQTAERVELAPGREFTYLSHVAGAGRMALRRELLDQVSWRPLPCGADALLSYDCIAIGAPLLAVDRFNHVFVRERSGGHTWRAPFRQVLASGDHRRMPAAARREDFDV